MVEKTIKFLDSVSTSNNWLPNSSCSFNQTNFCGLFNGIMPKMTRDECDQCSSKFFFIKKKHKCISCGLLYCSSCSRSIGNGQRKCKKCDILSIWPIDKAQVASLRVRDLRYFLISNGIKTDTCTEKKDMVELVIAHLRLKYYKENRRNQIHTPPETTSHSSENLSTVIPNDGIRVRPIHVSPVEEWQPHNSPDAGIRVFPSSDEHFSSRQELNLENLSNASSASSSWSMLDESRSGDDSQTVDEEASLSIEEGATALETPLIENVSHNEPVPERTLDPVPEMPFNAPKSHLAHIVKLSSLRDINDIKSLSVRQCKEILTLHRVDYSGLFEKHELVSKIKLLWEDYQKMNGDADNLPEDQLCKICMAAPLNCVLLECGHMVSCIFCGKQLAECPICRRNVIRIVRTFRA